MVAYCMCPDWGQGSNMQPRYMPLTGNQTRDPHSTEPHRPGLVCSFGRRPHWVDVQVYAWSSCWLREKALPVMESCCVCPPSASTTEKKRTLSEFASHHPKSISMVTFTECLLGFSLLQGTKLSFKLVLRGLFIVEKANKIT